MLAANIATAVEEYKNAQQWFNEYMDTVSLNPELIRDKEKVRDVAHLIVDKIISDEIESLYDESGNYLPNLKQELEKKKYSLTTKLEKTLRFACCTVNGNPSDQFDLVFSTLKNTTFEHELDLQVAFMVFIDE